MVGRCAQSPLPAIKLERIWVDYPEAKDKMELHAACEARGIRRIVRIVTAHEVCPMSARSNTCRHVA